VEALLALRGEAPFDVLLCDLMMPGMTGMELFARIAQDEPARSGG